MVESSWDSCGERAIHCAPVITIVIIYIYDICTYIYIFSKYYRGYKLPFPVMVGANGIVLPTLMGFHKKGSEFKKQIFKKHTRGFFNKTWNFANKWRDITVQNHHGNMLVPSRLFSVQLGRWRSWPVGKRLPDTEILGRYRCIMSNYTLV